MRVLDCVTKEELSRGDIVILQTENGNLFYYETFPNRDANSTTLSVKRGVEVIAELYCVDIDVIAEYGNEVVFTSKEKVHKAIFTPPSSIIVSYVRDLLKDEKLHSRGICSRKDGDKLYIYRLIDDPARDGILVDIEEQEREKFTLHSIHRGKVLYLAQKLDAEDATRPTVRTLCENVIVVEFNDMTPTWVWSRDSSPFIYIGDHEVMHTLDTSTMEFLMPLRFEHLHEPVYPRIRNIQSIVGVHNGTMSMICEKTDGRFYQISTRLPVRYYRKTEDNVTNTAKKENFQKIEDPDRSV